MKRPLLSFYLMGFVLLTMIISCQKLASPKEFGCLALVTPAYLKFNVIDKNSGQDLFFSASPKYQIVSLYLFEKNDKTRKDTIRPDVIGTGPSRYFKLRLNNTVLKDTLIFKIAPNTDDELMSIFKLTDGQCPQPIVDKAYFNGVMLTANQDIYTINK